MGACQTLPKADAPRVGCLKIQEPPRCALIWLHGLGDTEKKWAGVMTNEVLPHLEAVAGPCKLVTPLAPRAPVMCCRGQQTTRWFDMAELPVGAGHAPPRFGCSLQDATLSAARVHEIIDKLQQQGVPAKRIAVGGFSQGGAMAMLSALKYPQRLAGCIALSGLLLGSDQLQDIISPDNRGLEVLWCHGEDDRVVLPSMQRVGCEALQQAGVPVFKRQYKAGHCAHPSFIADTASFLAERLAVEDSSGPPSAEDTASAEGSQGSQCTISI